MANHCGPWDNEFLELIKVSLEHVLKTTPPQPTYGVHDMFGDTQEAQPATSTYFFRLADLYLMSRLQATV